MLFGSMSSAQTSIAAAKPPQLALRFAAYTGVALVVVGLAMLWVLKRDVETRAEERAVSQTQLVAEATLKRHLRGSDFARPVNRRRARALDRVFQDIAVGGFVRASLFNSAGVVTYSTEHAVIGTHGPPEALDPVTHGRSNREEERVDGVKMLRAYVPVRVAKDARPIGSLSLSQDYRAIDVQIVEAFRHTAVILLLALLALWAALIPILRRATAQLHERNRRLADQTRQLEEALEERRRAEDTVLQLAAIVESSADAIAGTTPDGEMIGQRIAVLVPHDRRHELGSVARRISAGESVEEHQTRGLRKDGSEVDVSLAVSPIRDSLRRVVGSAVIARDITQTKRYQSQLHALLAKERIARAEAEAAQRALAEQNERLRELDRLKDEFISLVSHELRTPLTSIRGYLELLLDGAAGEFTEEQQRFLAVVDRNSKRLMHLVGDLLFLAQIDAGKVTLELRPVELEGVVAECIEAAMPIAADKGIGLTVTVGA